MKTLTSKLSLCAFALFLLSSLTPSLGLRILGMFPYNGKSHFAMSGQLMQGLAERGHQVDVYSHFPLKTKITNYTDYSFSQLTDKTNNLTYEFMSSVMTKFSIFKIIQRQGIESCKLLEAPLIQNLLHNPPKDPPYDVIILEYFFSYCFLALGRHLNIPMIGVSTSIPMDWTNDAVGNPSNPAVDPSVFSAHVAPMTFIERLSNFLFIQHTKISFNYGISEQDKIVEKVFGPGYPNVVELERDLSLALLNYHYAINGVRPWTPAMIPVAGLHVVDNNETLPEVVQKCLDESTAGFIYFSFGSMVRIETFPKHLLDAFYKAFEKIAPVRVLMKIVKLEELPPGLPSNVITHHWLPQIQVLKHKNIKAFITHGGLMGTQESIYYGVPMVGIPLFADQHFNIKAYARRNIAIKIDLNQITEERFMQVVTEILENPIYKKNVEKVSSSFRDTPLSPMDTAAFWVEYIARHGKDSLRSPLVDMSWWKVSLLDVYAFIGATLLTVLYIVKLILKKLTSIVSSKVCNKLSTLKVKSN